MPGVTVNVVSEVKAVRFPRQKLAKLVRAVCTRFGLENAAVDIAIVDNSSIRKLNKRFLNRKAVTDCLAFDLSQPGENLRRFELVVNGERAASESAQRNHSVGAEVALYVTHGLLHNLGFNDLLPKDAKRMHRLEDEILQQQGFGRIYEKMKNPQRPATPFGRPKNL
jgi:probable rRNA maturation factor